MRRLEAVDPTERDRFLELDAQHRRWTAHELPKREAELGFFAERIAEIEKASSQSSSPPSSHPSPRNPRPNRPAPSSPEAPPIPPPLPSSAPRQAVSRDPNRSRAHALREELRRLSRQRLALSEELDGPQLTLQQQKDALLQRVKADNGEIADAERRVAEAQDSVRRGRGQLSQLDVDLNEANNPKTQKYQVGRVPMILVGAPRRPPKAPRPARSARAGALSARQGDVRAHRLVRPPEGGGAP